MAVLGALIEMAAAYDLERSLGLTAEVYRQGEAGQMMRAARWLTPAGGVAALAAPRSRAAALAAAGLLTAGALTTRLGRVQGRPRLGRRPQVRHRQPAPYQVSELTSLPGGASRCRRPPAIQPLKVPATGPLSQPLPTVMRIRPAGPGTKDCIKSALLVVSE